MELIGPDEAKVSLAHEICRLERVTLDLLAHEPLRASTQVLVEDLCESCAALALSRQATPEETDDLPPARPVEVRRLLDGSLIIHGRL